MMRVVGGKIMDWGCRRTSGKTHMHHILTHMEPWSF
jgi:hypothetical protein